MDSFLARRFFKIFFWCKHFLELVGHNILNLSKKNGKKLSLLQWHTRYEPPLDMMLSPLHCNTSGLNVVKHSIDIRFLKIRFVCFLRTSQLICIGNLLDFFSLKEKHYRLFSHLTQLLERLFCLISFQVIAGGSDCGNGEGSSNVNMTGSKFILGKNLVQGYSGFHAYVKDFSLQDQLFTSNGYSIFVRFTWLVLVQIIKLPCKSSWFLISQWRVCVPCSNWNWLTGL